MKKLFIAILIFVAIAWSGCAILTSFTPQDARNLITNTNMAHDVLIRTVYVLAEKKILTPDDKAKISIIDKDYHKAVEILSDAIVTWEIALTVSEKEGEKKREALNRAIGEFLAVMNDLNNLIFEIKSRPEKAKPKGDKV